MARLLLAHPGRQLGRLNITRLLNPRLGACGDRVSL